MEKRFRVLRIIGTIYKVLAWVALALGILGGLVALGAFALGGAQMARQLPKPYAFSPWAGLAGGITGAAVILLAAIFYFLILYAAGEFVYLALTIEENTRETARYLHGKETSPES